MVRKSILGLVDLGLYLRFLLERKEGDWITHEKESEWKQVWVERTIEYLLESFKEYDMAVTLRAAERLRQFLEEVRDRETGSTLTKEQADKLREIILLLTKTFRAEAAGMHSFFTTDKRISMDKLTAKHELLFPEGVFSELSEIAKYDVKEAGMCIAFERSTVAAYHILRATEEVLRNLYCRIVRRKRIKSLIWGNITNDLAKRKKRPSATTMKNLEYIRDNFRNPTAHPEARYGIEEAQSLFNLCTDVISRIIKDPLWNKG